MKLVVLFSLILAVTLIVVYADEISDPLLGKLNEV